MIDTNEYVWSWMLAESIVIVSGRMTCQCCKRLMLDVERRRRNTAYCDELDECNWLDACGECQQEDDDYNAERWDEYYSSR